MPAEYRTLGQTEIQLTPVAMGCWPIAGMTSIDVNKADSVKTLEAALASGVNFFDTAYCYGANGESEKMLGEVLKDHRDELVLATKGGIHWNGPRERVHDGRPETLKRECEESLQRLGTDHVELYYLHAPDPKVPIEESAGAIRELIQTGKVRCAGASNVNVEQLKAFQTACPVSAIQPPYNMLQRDIEDDLLPHCQANSISVLVYWPLMKGLLAGKLARDHVFAPNDGRAKYPMFQGEEWHKNQDFLDELRQVAVATGKSVTQVVVNWTINRPGITAALCGAKRAYQIEESAGAMGWQLNDQELQQIDEALKKRGTPVTRSAV